MLYLRNGFLRVGAVFILLSGVPSMAMDEPMWPKLELIRTYIDDALKNEDYSKDTFNRIGDLHKAIAKSEQLAKDVEVDSFSHYVDKTGGLKCSKPLFCDYEDSFFDRAAPSDSQDDYFCCLVCCFIPCHTIQFFCGWFLPCGWEYGCCCHVEETTTRVDNNSIKRSLEALKVLYANEYWKKYQPTSH